MALSSIINRKEYGPLSGITIGDLVAAWGYRISDESDLEVYVVESDGTTTGPLTQDVDYEIVSNLSGTLITSCNINAKDADKFPDGCSVIVVRQTNFLQSSDYKTNGVILSDTLENDLDKLAMQTQQLKDDITRSVRFSASLLESETPDPEISFDATARSNKVLGFDADGDFAVTQELGTFVGDWTDGTDYQTRDIVRTWGLETDDNYGSLWIAKQSHTADAASGKSPDDTAPLASNDYWDLILDTGHFATQADVAATNANTSESKATEAEDWANKTDGDVVVDEVASGEYSAKAYAIGGTGVTGAAGSAKDWATKTVGTVDGTNYSAKYWATRADVGTVAGLDTEIQAVAAISSDVSTVSGISSDVTTVAADGTDIGTVATNIANVNSVAGVSSNVTTVATNIANVNTVAGVSANVTTVAGVSADVTSVAGVSTEVATVADNIANVNTVAAGIEDVNRYAEEYTISATEPTSPSEGDLWYDSTNNALKVRTATAWAVIEAVPQPLATTDSPTFAGITAGTADINGGTIDGTTIGGTTAAAGTFTTFTSTGITDNASSTTVTVDSSGNVGIGATSMGATQKLLVKYIPSGDFTPVTNTAYNHLTVQGNNNGHAGITIASPNSSNQTGALAFADTVSAFAGLIAYRHSTDQMLFYTSGTERLSIDGSGNLKFDSGYGSVATAYGCRAWVNFRGTSQSGTATASGLVSGQYTATVTSASQFTVVYSGTTYTINTSGNHEIGDGEGVDLTVSGTTVTIDTQIRASGNVSSITDNGTGDYTVNFTNAMSDSDYCVVSQGSRSSGQGSPRIINHVEGTTKTTTSIRLSCEASTDGTQQDNADLNVAIFR